MQNRGSDISNYLFGLFPVVPIPNSCMFDIPIIIAPPSLNFFTIQASSVAGVLPINVVPQRVWYGTFKNSIDMDHF